MGTAAEPVGGLSARAVDPLRYDGNTADPREATGMLIARIPDRARVLDVGCGTGAGSLLIRDLRTADVVGVEPDPARAAAATARGIRVITAPFGPGVADGDGPFDVVVFADVLEHLVDPAAALLAARAVLAPGGRVVASVPNVAHWSVRFDLLFGRFEYRECGIRDATHLRWFTRAGIIRLFEAAGFRVESYGVTAGVGLPEYWERLPWRVLPLSVRWPLVRALRWCLPGLFGCQHVVDARPVGAT